MKGVAQAVVKSAKAGRAEAPDRDAAASTASIVHAWSGSLRS